MEFVKLLSMYEMKLEEASGVGRVKGDENYWHMSVPKPPPVQYVTV